MIRRRCHGSIRDFFELYAPLANSWTIFENSQHGLHTIAEGEGRTVVKKEGNEMDDQDPQEVERLDDRIFRGAAAAIRDEVAELQRLGLPVWVEANDVIYDATKGRPPELLDESA